jgi:DNA-binding MarR family transcriptional regulator
MTAGSLSTMTGLTTGAITHILDRLEKRHFIDRVRDSRDRRKVFVRVRGESLEPLIPTYEGIGKAYMSLAERYGDEQLAVICDYFERASEVSKRELANLVAANASRTLRKSTPSRRGRGRSQ